MTVAEELARARQLEQEALAVYMEDRWYDAIELGLTREERHEYYWLNEDGCIFEEDDEDIPEVINCKLCTTLEERWKHE